MKKYILILAVGAVLSLTACGSGSTTNVTTDSTEISVDTVANVSDTTSTEVDSVSTETKTEEPSK